MKNRAKTKKLTVMLDEENLKRLKKDAEENLCSVSYIVRKAIQSYYSNKNKTLKE